MKRIHLLRAGSHTDNAGRKHDFSAAVLGDVAASYDPALHEAPLVVGHPAANRPAYGLVASLSAEPDGLYAEPTRVDPEFAELVKTGRFPKISASLYPPDNPSNPTPGRWHLRHVGFLGAQPPAVKGLKPIEFAAGDDPAAAVDIEIDFAEGAGPRPHVFGGLARMLRGLREWIVSNHDVETADRLIGNHDIEALSAEEARMRKAAAAAMRASDYADPAADPAAGGCESEATETGGPEMGDKTTEQLQAELAEAKAENERLARAAGRASVDRDVADLAESTGNVTDAERPVIAAILAVLPDGEDAASADFAEGDDGAKLSPRAGALAVLKSIAGRAKNRAGKPPIAGEIAGADRGEPPVNLAETPLDAEAQRKIARIMRAENLTFGAALNKALGG